LLADTIRRDNLSLGGSRTINLGRNGGIFLAEVIIGANESIDQALRRFNKLVQQTGILAEARRREHYESPSIRRKKKAAAKRRKSLKNSQRG